ncbi:MAG: helix-turn-helix transcriptional regulator [Oscillospiraceae bacterium]|nr:helix-turn-helix transcriptional regulator [Oscillospiraceae bacterium]
MERSFPETLSALRRERNISQRAAAADLNISQALLSHYENGVREPGLSFVCRACDYYGVSADYLLCRSDNTNPVHNIAAMTVDFLDNMQQILDKARQEVKQLSTEEDKI